MKHCMQLPNRFDLSSLDAVTPVLHRTYSKRQKYNRDIDERYTLIPTATYSLPDAVVAQLVEQLPQAVRDVEVPKVFILQMEASDAQRPVLGAHVDFNRSCGINVYLEANGEITHYHTWNNETQTLAEDEQFVAEAGDCWLMDTTVPHSVSLVPGKQRRMLTFSFVSARYEQIRMAYQ